MILTDWCTNNLTVNLKCRMPVGWVFAAKSDKLMKNVCKLRGRVSHKERANCGGKTCELRTLEANIAAVGFACPAAQNLNNVVRDSSSTETCSTTLAKRVTLISLNIEIMGLT